MKLMALVLDDAVVVLGEAQLVERVNARSDDQQRADEAGLFLGRQSVP